VEEPSSNACQNRNKTQHDEDVRGHAHEGKVLQSTDPRERHPRQQQQREDRTEEQLVAEMVHNRRREVKAEHLDNLA